MAKIYKYKDYEEYVEWQTKTNKSKITWTFVREDVINKLSKLNPDAKNIICHGTRNGTEQKHFLKNPVHLTCPRKKPSPAPVPWNEGGETKGTGSNLNSTFSNLCTAMTGNLANHRGCR